MAIMDKELELISGLVFDHGDPVEDSVTAGRIHGRGRQVCLRIWGVTGDLEILSGDGPVPASNLITIHNIPHSSIGPIRVMLPTHCARYIAATFPDGTIDVVLDSVQDNI